MTYRYRTPYRGIGAYRSPYRGIGAYRSPYRGIGCSCAGFGASFEFNATQTCDDFSTATCGGADRGACLRGADQIRLALGQLGYGQLKLGGDWSNSDISASRAFARAVGLPASDYPTCALITAMGEALKAGDKPGPQEAPPLTKVGGRTVAGTSSAKADGGVGSYIVLGVVGLAVIGGLALLGKRKKGAAEEKAKAAAKL